MGFEWVVANLSRVHLQISDSPMSAVSGDHDDDDDGSKKDGVGVPQLIVDTGHPTESQAEQTLAKGILPSVEEVSTCVPSTYGFCYDESGL